MNSHELPFQLFGVDYSVWFEGFLVVLATVSAIVALMKSRSSRNTRDEYTNEFRAFADQFSKQKLRSGDMSPLSREELLISFIDQTGTNPFDQDIKSTRMISLLTRNGRQII
jgi:hypothetical protein